MTTPDATITTSSIAPHGIRRISQRDLNWALAEGWRDFAAMRGEILFLALLYPLLGVLAAAAAADARLLPLFFPLVAGLSVMGPAVASGFYEMARRRDTGLSANWQHFLDPLKGRSRGGLMVLTLVLLVLFGAWLAVAWLIYAGTIGVYGPMDAAEFFRRLFTTSDGWTLIALGNLAGFGFAVATLVFSVASFPMVVDRPIGAGAAVWTSIRAARANPVTIATWGVLVAGLLVLGSLPAFIGLAVVLPWLGYSTWHLYTRMVER